MESIISKLAFTLGRDIPSFGKKGDRVWQVHRASLGQTISIVWVNAETKATHTIMKKQKAEPEPADLPAVPTRHERGQLLLKHSESKPKHQC